MTVRAGTIRRSGAGLKVAASACALAVLLAACGGTDDADDGSTDAADTESEEDTEAEDDSASEDDAESEEDTESESGSDADLELAIRIADGYPAINPLVEGGANPFMERLVEEGEARGITVDIEYFGDQSLAGQAELLDTIGTGVTDIGAVALSYFAEVIPAAGISELPARYDSSEAGSVVFLQLIQDELMDDFTAENVRPLFLGALAPYELFSVDTPIEEVGDASGLNIRSPGGVCDQSLEAIGANPVQMPVADQYIALERGTIDGVIGPHANHRAYQIEEGTNYATDGLAMCGVTNLYMVNEDWFQDQPPEVQELLVDIGNETARGLGAFLDEAEGATTEYYADYGMTISTIDDLGPWEDALSGVQDDWVERMEGLGVDGQALIDRWDELMADFS